MKTPQQKTGSDGEDEAVHYLRASDFVILHTNFRLRRAEVDIIASKNNCLHLIEVKTRKTNAHGFPEEFVSERKEELFLEVADHFVEELDWSGDIQFDIIALTLDSNELEHIEDAFR